MKRRMIVLSLLAALGSGCLTADKPRKAMQVEPLESIRHGAPNAQAQYQLGRYYQGQNRLEQAEAAYLKVLSVDPSHINALNALGSLYAKRGELERGVRMFEKVAAIAPEVAYVHNNLGFAYYLQGRQDDAYAAVRKALLLDQTLERAWANLERIAGMSSEGMVLAAVRSRRADALPPALAVQSIADGLVSEPVPLAINRDPEAKMPLAAAASPTAPSLPTARVAEMASARNVPRAPDGGAVVAMSSAVPDLRFAQNREDRIGGGRFVLVSASREVLANGQPITIANGESTVPAHSEPTDLPVPGVLRIEIANGNGVGRFARTFSAHLKSNNIAVTRITNNGSFALETTIVEYQPGHQLAGRALISRALPTAARLVPATSPRPGTDIRILLGRDALQLI